MQDDLATIRTGKANTAILENLLVEAYGSRMKLVELATLVATDPTTLVVTPFDITNVSAIAKAIETANLGLSVIVEDTKIRVLVPQLSAERRQEYVKLAKVKVEGGKIMLRQTRHEAMEEVEKAGADDDTKVRWEKEIQQLTDKMAAELDLLASKKETELLNI